MKRIPSEAVAFFPALSAIVLITITCTMAVAQPRAVEQPKLESRPDSVVTGQACMKCHEDVTKAFAVTPHGKTAQFMKGAQATSCDTCHGDPTRHNQSGNPGHISSPTKVPAAQASLMCLTCHSRNETHVSWQGSAHDRKDMTCVSCHKEHHPAPSARLLMRSGLRSTPMMQARVTEKLLKLPDQELCLSCHKEKRKAILQRSSHLFATERGDAKVTCTSCHNPHGGEGKAMLAATSKTQLCYGCHAEKRGPFLWEHTPARENCNTCHVPHGSNNPTLLKARTTVLCQQCHMHMMWRHQTVAGYDMFTFNKGCNNCHSQIHGSNHPSGKALTH
jgi:predicted CXXCH cytochrome family protein